MTRKKVKKKAKKKARKKTKKRPPAPPLPEDPIIVPPRGHVPSCVCRPCVANRVWVRQVAGPCCRDDDPKCTCPPCQCRRLVSAGRV